MTTKADSYICRCYSTTNNQDIHGEILLQKAIDKTASVKIKERERERERDRDRDRDTLTDDVLLLLTCG